MKETATQGIVSVTGTVLYTVPTTRRVKFITITAINSAAYMLTLTKFDKTTGTTITIFKYNLSAGDSVIDQTGYYLKEGDRLILTSSIAGTEFTTNFIVE